MSTDPTKAKVIELLREWCDDPPVSVDDAVKVLSGLVYPSKLERDEADYVTWADKQGWSINEYAKYKRTWMAARGYN